MKEVTIPGAKVEQERRRQFSPHLLSSLSAETISAQLKIHRMTKYSHHDITFCTNSKVQYQSLACPFRRISSIIQDSLYTSQYHL